MTYRATLTAKSRNQKTGPIPVSMTTSDTCPTACPFKGNGCYAESGPISWSWKRMGTEKRPASSWDDFCSDVAALPDGQLWRHNAAGDLPGDGETIDARALFDLCDANAGKRGFTYTHYEPIGENAKAIGLANASGFTVNLSANDRAHVDKLSALGIGPVVVVLPHDTDPKACAPTPEGCKVVVCPATYREDISCATCQLCQHQSPRVIVGFPAHGSSKAKANRIAAGV